MEKRELIKQSFFKRRLDFTNEPQTDLIQYSYNLLFVMLLIFGIGESIILSILFYPFCEEHQGCVLFFGNLSALIWLIYYGSIEIKNSLDPEYEFKLRAQTALEKGGCVCYCPYCNDILNDNALVVEMEDGLINYVCNTCENVSSWDFDIAPVPICVYPPDSSINEKNSK